VSLSHDPTGASVKRDHSALNQISDYLAENASRHRSDLAEYGSASSDFMENLEVQSGVSSRELRPVALRVAVRGNDARPGDGCDIPLSVT
jgi:hypothetical protein